jgi:hypothetical protein
MLKYLYYTQNAQGTQLCRILRVDSDSTLILTARSRIRELISSSLPHSDVGQPYFAADVQRQYEKDATVEASFAARCGNSRCRGTIGRL